MEYNNELPFEKRLTASESSAQEGKPVEELAAMSLVAIPSHVNW